MKITWLFLASMVMCGSAQSQNSSAPMVPIGAPSASRVTLGQSRIPMILPSSGSMGNNGALTLTTALDQTYPNAYFYMPAGAIVVASTAGFYYGTCASTTVCTLFNNTYSSGSPTIPSSPTAFVTTGPGAYTQTTGSAFTAWNMTIPGGTLGPNDEVQTHGVLSYNNSAGAKTLTLNYGTLTYGNSGPTTTASLVFMSSFANAGKLTRQIQVGNGAMSLTAGAFAPASSAIDSTTDQNLTTTLKLATATDYVILQSVVAERIVAASN